MELYGTEYFYSPLFEFEPIVAVVISGVLALLNIWIMFTYYFWFYNSLIDLINFILSALIYAPKLGMFFALISDLNNEEYRGTFYWLSFYSIAAPFVVWPITFLSYLTHSFLYTSTYTTASYIVVKALLFLIYNLLVVFFDYETLFPVYDWWQILAQLADRIPYTRPTEEQVRAADTLEDINPNVFEEELEESIEVAL